MDIEFNDELPCENCLKKGQSGRYKSAGTHIEIEKFEFIPVEVETKYIKWKCVVCGDICYTNYNE